MINSLEFENFFNNISKELGQKKEEAYNLCKYVQQVNDIKGDIVEIGVFKGKSAQILNYYKSVEKKLYLFDTFEGLIDCGNIDGNIIHNGSFQSNYNIVKKLFNSNDKVEIIIGYFPKMLPWNLRIKNFLLYI